MYSINIKYNPMAFLKFTLLFFILIINVLHANIFSFVKTNSQELDFYKYGAILPIITDSTGNKWVYFTLDIHNKKSVIDLFGGLIEKKDKSVFKAAIRELNEESLDVFGNTSYINLKAIDYKVFRTKLFIISIKNNKLNNHCDYFTKNYYLRRYGGLKKYRHLTLAQTETVGMRKVKLRFETKILLSFAILKNSLVNLNKKNL